MEIMSVHYSNSNSNNMLSMWVEENDSTYVLFNFSFDFNVFCTRVQSNGRGYETDGMKVYSKEIIKNWTK